MFTTSSPDELLYLFIGSGCCCVTDIGLSASCLQSEVYAEMSLVATLLILIHIHLSFEESLTFLIPLRHSLTNFIDTEMENGFDSRSKRALPADANYNLHGTLGQGYYIELAVGQPEQMVNHVHIFLYLI